MLGPHARQLRLERRRAAAAAAAAGGGVFGSAVVERARGDPLMHRLRRRGSVRGAREGDTRASTHDASTPSLSTLCRTRIGISPNFANNMNNVCVCGRL